MNLLLDFFGVIRCRFCNRIIERETAQCPLCLGIIKDEGNNYNYNKKVKAWFYKFLLIVFLPIAIIFHLIYLFIIPVYYFSEFGSGLPLLTTIIVGISRFIRQNTIKWGAIWIAIVLIIFLLKRKFYHLLSYRQRAENLGITLIVLIVAFYLPIFQLILIHLF